MIKKAADNTQYKKLAISVCGKLKRLQSQLFILPLGVMNKTTL